LNWRRLRLGVGKDVTDGVVAGWLGRGRSSLCDVLCRNKRGRIGQDRHGGDDSVCVDRLLGVLGLYLLVRLRVHIFERTALHFLDGSAERLLLPVRVGHKVLRDGNVFGVNLGELAETTHGSAKLETKWCFF
jgi:hypothetical protein